MPRRSHGQPALPALPGVRASSPCARAFFARSVTLVYEAAGDGAHLQTTAFLSPIYMDGSGSVAAKVSDQTRLLKTDEECGGGQQLAKVAPL